MNNSKIAILIGLLLVSCVIQARMTVAVQDFTAENCEAYIGAVSSREFRNVLVGNKELTVLDRSSMEIILKEQDFQISGCTSAECAIEMGKLLAANFIITGTVSKMGNAYYISINCIGVETGEIKYSKSNYIEGGVELVMPLSHNIAAEFSNEYFGTNFPMKALSRKIEEPIPNNFQLDPQPQKAIAKKSDYTGYGFLDLSYAFGFGNMQLQFIRSDPEMTAAEFGISGDIPPSFYAINWALAKIAVKTPITFRLGGFFPSKKDPSKPGSGFAIDLFYLRANIVPQTTEWWINNSKSGSFTFHSDNYFSTSVFGMDIIFLKTFFAQKNIHIYGGFGLGFSINSWEAPTIMGYTESSAFSAPSKGTAFGFNVPISLGFRFNLTKSLQLFTEYNFMLSGFKPNRNVKNENNLAGHFVSRIHLGLSLILQ
ncbi:hypothetical protein KAJ26_05170 [bacterium]|nr:hypothetical protein [bacterium]